MGKLMFQGGCADGEFLEVQNPPSGRISIPFTLPMKATLELPDITKFPAYGVDVYELKAPVAGPMFYEVVGGYTSIDEQIAGQLCGGVQ